MRRGERYRDFPKKPSLAASANIPNQRPIAQAVPSLSVGFLVAGSFLPAAAIDSAPPGVRSV